MNAFPPEEIVYQTSHRSDNRSTLLTAVSSVFTGAAVLSFIVRIISRRVARAKIGWDDYLSFGSAIALIGVNIPACLTAHYGIGRHLLTVAQNPENFVKIGKATLAFSAFYNCSMTLAKLAVLALFARIFTLSSRMIQIGISFFTAYTLLWCVAGMLVIFLGCRPLSSNWGEPYQCRPDFKTSVSVGIVNIISDIRILALPQPAILGLHLSFRRKLALGFVFMMGGLATVVSIARIPMLKGANSGAELDSTYTYMNGILFTVIEPACVVLCGSLPMFPCLFNRMLKPQTKSGCGRSGGGSGGSEGSRGKYAWSGTKKTEGGYGRGNKSGISESTEALELSDTTIPA